MAVTGAWGATFLWSTSPYTTTGPVFFAAVRFLTGELLSAVVPALAARTDRARDGGWNLDRADDVRRLRPATWALQHTTASAAAFLTALQVPLIPLLAWACFRVLPRPPKLAGMALAFVGLVLLAGPGGAELGLIVAGVLVSELRPQNLRNDGTRAVTDRPGAGHEDLQAMTSGAGSPSWSRLADRARSTQTASGSFDGEVVARTATGQRGAGRKRTASETAVETRRNTTQKATRLVT